MAQQGAGRVYTRRHGQALMGEQDMTETRKRARNMAEWAKVMSGLVPTEAQLAAAKPYAPRPSDVIITPYAKCGTTLLQQMFHQLRMADAGVDGRGGDMDFDDISRVVPWIETAPSLDLDINAEQRSNPRGFKSHLHYEGLPPGALYVAALRDPHDSCVSFYRFMEGWTFETGAITMEDFMPAWLSGGPSRTDYFTHLLSWWARRDEADTLLMTYRHIVKQKRDAIARLAALMGLPLDEETTAMVERRTAREYMLEHKAPFADPMMRRLSEERGGLPKGGDSAKIRAADTPDRELPDSLSAQIDALWAERITPVTGHANFAELAAELGR